MPQLEQRPELGRQGSSSNPAVSIWRAGGVTLAALGCAAIALLIAVLAVSAGLGLSFNASGLAASTGPGWPWRIDSLFSAGADLFPIGVTGWVCAWCVQLVAQRVAGRALGASWPVAAIVMVALLFGEGGARWTWPPIAVAACLSWLAVWAVYRLDDEAIARIGLRRPRAKPIASAGALVVAAFGLLSLGFAYLHPLSAAVASSLSFVKTGGSGEDIAETVLIFNDNLPNVKLDAVDAQPRMLAGQVTLSLVHAGGVVLQPAGGDTTPRAPTAEPSFAGKLVPGNGGSLALTAVFRLTRCGGARKTATLPALNLRYTAFGVKQTYPVAPSRVVSTRCEV